MNMLFLFHFAAVFLALIGVGVFFGLNSDHPWQQNLANVITGISLLALGVINELIARAVKANGKPYRSWGPHTSNYWLVGGAIVIVMITVVYLLIEGPHR